MRFFSSRSSSSEGKGRRGNKNKTVGGRGLYSMIHEFDWESVRKYLCTKNGKNEVSNGLDECGGEDSPLLRSALYNVVSAHCFLETPPPLDVVQTIYILNPDVKKYHNYHEILFEAYVNTYVNYCQFASDGRLDDDDDDDDVREKAVRTGADVCRFLTQCSYDGHLLKEQTVVDEDGNRSDTGDVLETLLRKAGERARRSDEWGAVHPDLLLLLCASEPKLLLPKQDVDFNDDEDGRVAPTTTTTSTKHCDVELLVAVLEGYDKLRKAGLDRLCEWKTRGFLVLLRGHDYYEGLERKTSSDNENAKPHPARAGLDMFDAERKEDAFDHVAASLVDDSLCRVWPSDGGKKKRRFARLVLHIASTEGVPEERYDWVRDVMNNGS